MITKIQILKAQDVLPLRAEILRPGKDISKAKLPMDHAPDTMHLGLFIAGKLASVATFHKDHAKNLSAGNPYRLRGMATDKKYQGQGLGKQILDFGIQQLLMRDCDLLWCNARETAFVFYEKCGFTYEGEMFEIEEIGPHKVMYKYLKPI